MIEIVSVKLLAGGDGFFNYPSGIRLCHETNTFYIADMLNHRVYWLKGDGSSGALSNVVDGDDTCSSLDRPLALWVTKQETLFVADAEHNKIFCKAKQDDVWRPIKIDSDFSFNLPGGIAVDESGNIYTNDFLNNRLVHITPEGKVTVLIDGKEKVSKPYGIFYQRNKLYYTDTGNAQICYIDLKDGQVHILNPQTGTKDLSSPITITLDDEGNIYIFEQRSMYFLDVKSNILSLIIDRDIWKEQMNRYGIKDRICHMGAATVKRKGEVYWIDTIKGCIYQIVLKFS